MGGNEQSILVLISQLRKYWLKKSPYDLPYDNIRDTPEIWWMTCPEKPTYLQRIALKLLNIVPHSANCERIFSVLRWFYGQRRTRLDPSRISKMAKIHSYYISNAKNQLQYYGNLLSEKEVQDQVIFATQNLNNFQELEKEEEDNLELLLFDKEEEIIPQVAKEIIEEEELKRILQIEVYANLSNNIFTENENYINIEDNEVMEEFNENENKEFNLEELIN